MVPNPSSGVERDPVCGMTVDPATAQAVVEHAGKRYYFCCPGCARKFQLAPDQYLRPRASSSGLVALGARPAATMPLSMVQPAPGVDSPESAMPSAAAPPPSGAYVCPMCPEVRESKPGPCPSCGMSLEAETPAASTK